MENHFDTQENINKEYDFREQFPELYKKIQEDSKQESQYKELGQIKTDYLMVEQFEIGVAYVLYNLEFFTPYLNSMGFYKKDNNESNT